MSLWAQRVISVSFMPNKSKPRRTSRRRGPISQQLLEIPFVGQIIGQEDFSGQKRATKMLIIINFINKNGGQGGIRTRDRVAPIHTFQACAFNHSATCPQRAPGRTQHFQPGRVSLRLTLCAFNHRGTPVSNVRKGARRSTGRRAGSYPCPVSSASPRAMTARAPDCKCAEHPTRAKITPRMRSLALWRAGAPCIGPGCGAHRGQETVT